MDKSISNQPAKGKRETIMASAFELFFSKGYQNTKIIEIAESANIGKGTFYEYFKSKESLLFELLDAKFQTDKQKIELIACTTLSSTDKIKGFFQFEIDCMKKYGPSSNVLAQEMMSPSFDVSDEIIGIMHEMFLYKYEFINRVITEGMDTNEFKKTDSSLAATGILGAISFYTAFKFNIINHHVAPSMPFENNNWDNEGFFQLIFTGLK